jgi:hypothetical protein
MSKAVVCIIGVVSLVWISAVYSLPLSGTSFSGFTTGVSVNGQSGWATSGTWDESVVDDGTGNEVWRVSNAVTSGSFGDMPFAPRPGGIPNDTVNDPVNSEPLFFAGEPSTGAEFSRFLSEFAFRSATGAPQPGLRITVSIDNGTGGRQSFVALSDTGSGIDVETFDVTKNGEFIGPIAIATGLSYTGWHNVRMEAAFKKGPNNDRVKYFVNNKMVHDGQSWEQFYRNEQAALHPNGVPVQTLLFRLSGDSAPGVAGGGFFIDNVFTQTE